MYQFPAEENKKILKKEAIKQILFFLFGHICFSFLSLIWGW